MRPRFWEINIHIDIFAVIDIYFSLSLSLSYGFGYR